VSGGGALATNLSAFSRNTASFGGVYVKLVTSFFRPPTRCMYAWRLTPGRHSPNNVRRAQALPRRKCAARLGARRLRWVAQRGLGRRGFRRAQMRGERSERCARTHVCLRAEAVVVGVRTPRFRSRPPRLSTLLAPTPLPPLSTPSYFCFVTCVRLMT
jgi:hypothetical protein